MISAPPSPPAIARMAFNRSEGAPAAHTASRQRTFACHLAAILIDASSTAMLIGVMMPRYAGLYRHAALRAEMPATPSAENGHAGRKRCKRGAFRSTRFACMIGIADFISSGIHSTILVLTAIAAPRYLAGGMRLSRHQSNRPASRCHSLFLDAHATAAVAAGLHFSGSRRFDISVFIRAVSPFDRVNRCFSIFAHIARFRYWRRVDALTHSHDAIADFGRCDERHAAMRR